MIFNGLFSLGNKGNSAQTPALCTSSIRANQITKTKQKKTQHAAVRLQGPHGPGQGWNKTLSQFHTIIITLFRPIRDHKQWSFKQTTDCCRLMCFTTGITVAKLRCTEWICEVQYFNTTKTNDVQTKRYIYINNFKKKR